MQLVTINDGRGGSAGVRLRSGEVASLPMTARDGTLERWIPATVREIFEGGPEAMAIVGGLVARLEAAPDDERARWRRGGALRGPDTPLLAPIPEPRLIMAAGLAYRSHLEEMAGTPAPPHPTGFMKSPTSVSGPDDVLSVPPQAPEHVDYEGELAVVFGRTCHNVQAERALDYVGGYTAANDFSARDWVKPVWEAREPWESRLSWEVNLMGKQMPGFTALGPVITTADEIDDVTALTLTTRLNGEVMQQQPISDLIFSIPEMIAYFSRWYVFRPGDVLLTGTPAGVGLGRKPPVFMKAGDRIEVTIDRIGGLVTNFA